jgi:RNA polymerase subunit RPABC4/transcription elongation factor Spt4
MKSNATFVCPNCGAILPANAKACPECGSDENTGWSENTYMDGIDLPFDDDEYEEIRAKEFPNAGKKFGINVNWKMAIGVLVVAAMLLAFVFRC